MIKFIGNTSSNYARGKDKKKRKRRLIVPGLITTGLAGIGAKVGGDREQSSIIVNHINPTPSHKNALKYIKHMRSQQLPKGASSQINNKFLRNKSRYVKLFDKAKKVGGIKGAAIGAGIGLSASLLYNRLRNKDK